MGTACTYESENSETEKKTQHKRRQRKRAYRYIKTNKDDQEFSFVVTDELLDQLRADVLLIFVQPIDNVTSLKESQQFARFPQEAKLLDEILAQIKKDTIKQNAQNQKKSKENNSSGCYQEDRNEKSLKKVGDKTKYFATYKNNTIYNFHYKYVTFVFCEIWDGDGETYFKKMRKNIDKIWGSYREQVKSFVIPQFMPNLGLWLKAGLDVVVRSLLDNNGPLDVFLCCQNEHSKRLISQYISYETYNKQEKQEKGNKKGKSKKKGKVGTTNELNSPSEKDSTENYY